MKHALKRLIAYLIDLIILIPVAAFWSFGALFVLWGYFTLFEASPWQATPGKKLMRLQVVTSRGEKLSFGHAFLRFPIALSFCQIGSIFYFLTPSKRTLSDIFTKTQTISGRPQ